MNNKETYTKIFLQQLGKSTNDVTVKEHMHIWWQNTRKKEKGGLRLTEEGYNMLKEIELTVYDIPYPRDMPFTTQVIIFLDQFITCPYVITSKSIIVTDERTALELSLFSGDVRKYGLIKAMKRQQKDED